MSFGNCDVDILPVAFDVEDHLNVFGFVPPQKAVSDAADVEFLADSPGKIVDRLGIHLLADHPIDIVAEEGADPAVRVAGDFHTLNDVTRINIAPDWLPAKRRLPHMQPSQNDFHDSVSANGLPDLNIRIHRA